MKFEQKPQILTNQKSNDDDEDDEDDSGNFIYMYNDPKPVNDVDAYIDGPITHVSNYRNLLHYMRSMDEYDRLTIWLHSGGGNFDTMMSIIQAMENAKGRIQTNIDGPCHSAASMIALASPSLNVSEGAHMLCHAASHGSIGKQNEVVSRVIFSERQLSSFIRKIYADFLSPDEIDIMLIGKDFWLDYDDICARLNTRQQAQEERAKQSSDSNVKPATKKTKKTT